MTQATVEERLAALEAEVVELKARMNGLQFEQNGLQNRPMTIPGLGKIGCLKDFPDPEGLAEAMKQAREELNQIVVDDQDDC